MSENPRTLAERIEQELLPTLNIAVLLIPVIAIAMQLGSAAAGFVAATSPTDLAKLETPAQTRTQVEQRRSADDPRPAPADPKSGASAPTQTRESLADPLLGYGI